MKPLPCMLLIILSITVAAQAAEKPKLFIAHAENSHEIKFPSAQIVFKDGLKSQEREVAKAFVKRCPKVDITIESNLADFFVGFQRREGKVGFQRRGGKNNGIAVFTKNGLFISASWTKTLRGGVKFACKAILRQAELSK